MKKIKQFHDRAHRAVEGKSKNLMNFIMPLKMFACAIFAGFIILYMMSGVLYAYITGEEFIYAVPFAFILQGLLLATLISLLWSIFFTDVFIKKWRSFKRIILFSITLMALMAVCVLTFMAIPTDWANLWLITNGVVGIGLIVFSFISEVYFKTAGKRYTDVLKKFQANIN